MTDSQPQATGGSRRTFLKSSAVTGAALVSSLAARSYAQEDNTINIALIGCGGRGTGATDQALKTSASGPVKLVAMADAFGDRLESSRQTLADAHPDQVDVPEDRRFVGLDAYKQAVEAVGEGDVVILATPPGWRPVHFEYAVNQNRNIFMEKPVATDAAGVRRVLAAAEIAKQKNLKVGVGLQRHHDLRYQECVKRIQDGEIGDLSYMHVYWNDSGVWVRNRLEGMTEMEYQTLNWYYYTWLCGDHIVEQHIHNLDVGNWVMNDYPIYAEGMGGRQVRTGKQYGQIYDHHAVEYVYANGVRMYSYCRHMQGTRRQVTEFVHGSKGSAAPAGTIWSDQSMRERAWAFPRRQEVENPYQAEHNVLFDAIRGNTPHMEAERGAMSTATAILGRTATYSGQLVRMDRFLERGEALAPGLDSYTFDSTPPVLPTLPGFYTEPDGTAVFETDGYYPVPMPGEVDPLKA